MEEYEVIEGEELDAFSHIEDDPEYMEYLFDDLDEWTSDDSGPHYKD